MKAKNSLKKIFGKRRYSNDNDPNLFPGKKFNVFKPIKEDPKIIFQKKEEKKTKLMRDYIYESLYDPKYGYFGKKGNK
jgi:hypothetical protein